MSRRDSFLTDPELLNECVCVCVCCSSVFSVAGLTEICSCSVCVCVCVCVRFSLTSRGGRRTSAHELLFHSCPSSLGLVFARALSLRSVRRGHVYPECTKARKDRFTHKALLPIPSQSSLSISLSCTLAHFQSLICYLLQSQV